MLTQAAHYTIRDDAAVELPLKTNSHMTALDEISRHNREVMIQRIKTYWLQGVLQESLHGGEIIDLGLAYRPSAVSGGDPGLWDSVSDVDIPLPSGTEISTVFNAAAGQLLVMGEPGAGKTTMLLMLVQDLLSLAEKDARVPIPVVFGLASWASEGSLEDWLVEELSNSYEVPRKLGRAWIAERRYIPLLDGLDEVEGPHRLSCARAINEFRRSYPTVPIMVTVRIRDYQTLNQRLRLDKAIVLQPLGADQIDAYLAARGDRLNGLRIALKQDITLRELAQSPLMLSIMTLAYNQVSPEKAISLVDLNTGRQFLFDVYVERMCRYRGGEAEYSPNDTVSWLSWLAYSLGQQKRNLFFIENMQPTWLPSHLLHVLERESKLSVALICAIPGLVGGILGLSAYGWPGLLAGIMLGLVAGVLPVATGRLLPSSKIDWRSIETVDTLEWSWQWAGLGLAVGAVGGLLIGGAMAWIVRLLGGAPAAPWGVLLSAFAGIGFMISNALARSEVKLRTEPGLGIRHSQQNGLKVGLAAGGLAVATSVVALFVGTLLGLQVDWWASLPLIGGLALYLAVLSGLTYGGLVTLQHRLLFRLLEREGLVPNDFVHFLDYAAERNLLRKVGGGYGYIHALLLDYFSHAHNWPQSSPAAYAV